VSSPTAPRQRLWGGVRDGNPGWSDSWREKIEKIEKIEKMDNIDKIITYEISKETY
jgi:hypothetical protein